MKNERFGLQKRVLSFLLCISTAILLSCIPTYAKGGAPTGFFVKRNREHLQPPLDPVYSYIEKYDCYYVDKACAAEGKEKKLYLTFDAGYENGNIAKILDILKEEEVPGAFFVLDHLIKKNTALVLRMADEGHLVCNHTAQHKDMTQFHEKEAFLAELRKLEDIYKAETARELDRYYRPPEGRLSEENLQFLEGTGYKTVLWSFAYADWDNKKQPSPADAKRKIMDNTHPGAIILLHPTSDTNVAILRDCIREWRRDGYVFGRLSELSEAENAMQ